MSKREIARADKRLKQMHKDDKATEAPRAATERTSSITVLVPGDTTRKYVHLEEAAVREVLQAEGALLHGTGKSRIVYRQDEGNKSRPCLKIPDAIVRPVESAEEAEQQELWLAHAASIVLKKRNVVLIDADEAVVSNRQAKDSWAEFLDKKQKYDPGLALIRTHDNMNEHLSKRVQWLASEIMAVQVPLIQINIIEVPQPDCKD